MKLLALEIPDDTTALAGWLQSHLIGLELAPLVAELEAVHGPVREVLTLEQLLGSRREAVLARGLEALPAERLRLLLVHPRLLLDLQESILISGGPFWGELAASEAMGSEQGTVLERTWKKVETSLTLVPEHGVSGRTKAAPSPPRLLRFPGRGLVSLAAAAMVLVAVFIAGRWSREGILQPPSPSAPVVSNGWGWSRPDALPQNASPRAYFTHLADAAHEWFNKRPDDSLALARRIAEFRQGCSRLILSQHQPLSAGDRTWLVEKCRAWAAKLDTHLAAVEAGQDPLKVRAEADETINKLIAALRDRAKNLA